MFALRKVGLALAVLSLTGCLSLPGIGDPLDGVSTVADLNVDQEAASAQLVAPGPDRGGLFSGIMSAISGADPAVRDPDTQSVPAGTLQDFGQISSTCDLPRRQRGTEVARVSGYRLYDSAPLSTGLRSHYITGFSDGCARQFSAALVLFGDIGTHEIVRYAQTEVELDYSATDNAYEGIKASFCRVAKGSPCGGRIDQLARTTTFVTAYKSFGGDAEWAEFLLHDGEVAAADLESL